MGVAGSAFADAGGSAGVAAAAADDAAGADAVAAGAELESFDGAVASVADEPVADVLAAAEVSAVADVPAVAEVDASSVAAYAAVPVNATNSAAAGKINFQRMSCSYGLP
jgi:hypothetical protein